MWEGILAGAGVAGLNGLLAWLLVRWAFERDPGSFALAVLGGMGARLVLVIALSLAVFALADVHRWAYAIALAATYLLGLGLEIAYVVHRNERARAQKKD